MSLVRSRDQRIADETSDYSGLQCSANGCPNRWSVDPGHLCSAHAWADASQWPGITERQQWSETERAMKRGQRKPEVRRLSFEEKKEILSALLTVTKRMGRSDANPKEWAYRLRAKQEAGQRLSEGQRLAVLEAIGQ